MRATVCQLPAAGTAGAREDAWRDLRRHVRREESDLVLLPEMPFHRWLPADPDPDPGAWRAGVEAHDRWMARLEELGARLVAGSRPVMDEEGCRFNEGFVWSADGGVRPAPRKRHLPDEPGFWEASWYDRGPEGPFTPVDLPGGIRAGFLICTDLWFGRHARELGRAGAHLILCPRATPAETREKWLIGGRAAAIVSGAWCLSSNFAGPLPPSGPAGTAGDGGVGDERLAFAGGGWIIEPEAGRVSGTTDEGSPFLTMEIDPAAAEAAKSTYPRYVD